MSEEKKETKACPACVEIKPEALLCHSWVVAWLILLPTVIGWALWHDWNKPEFWNAFTIFVWSVQTLVWLRGLQLYFVSVVLGRRYFFWLDAVDRLHVHRMNWWQKLLDRKGMSSTSLPKGPIFEIWVGGWFRRSKVLDSGKNFGWKIQVTGRWFSGLPRYLILTSMYDHVLSHSVRLTFSVFVREREIDYECLVRALKLVDTQHNVMQALYDLERRRVNDEAPAVAGQVGVGA